jgi:hypothetical protein
LRYAAASWSVPPVAVTLVGDGTHDPFNHLGFGGKNVQVIPPYMLEVDPWIKDAPCDTCFAQLNNDDPRDETSPQPGNPNASPAIFPDLMFGRLPAKSLAELTSLVTKIKDYEEAAVGSLVNSWRSRYSFVADNYQRVDGSTDGAGNFAAFSENGIADFTNRSAINRIYYDPCNPSHPITDLTPECYLPSRKLPSIADIAATRAAVINAFNAGSALIAYNGHSNQVQISDENFFQIEDVDKLTNAGQLPIVLQMTCFTAQFSVPRFDGTSLDEATLMRVGGGAIAVWGPSGLGVAHGHDALQRGFAKALQLATANSKAFTRPIGALTMAGYQELALNGGCCQDTIYTFVLLGDPLTRARIFVPSGILLPIVRR